MRKTGKLWALLILAGSIFSVPAELVKREWQELSDHQFSDLGQLVLRAGAGQWVHAESENFIYHVTLESLIPLAARQSEYAWRNLSEIFGGERAGKIHVFVLTDESVWRCVVRDSGLRDDGLAMKLGNDLCVLHIPDLPAMDAAIPHELVHWKLQNLYNARNLPLWFEEGLAAYFGGQILNSYRKSSGLKPVAIKPLPPGSNLLSFNELIRSKKYPEDEIQAAGYYRQSKELIGLLAEKAGNEGLITLAEIFSSGQADFKETLAQKFQWSEEDISRLAEEVEIRVRAGE